MSCRAENGHQPFHEGQLGCTRTTGIESMSAKMIDDPMTHYKARQTQVEEAPRVSRRSSLPHQRSPNGRRSKAAILVALPLCVDREKPKHFRRRIRPLGVGM